MCGGLSHTAVLLPGLVYHRGVWRVEGRSKCAQEASQQRKAQSTPSTKHGPAITVTDVIWYSKHVARIAGQFKVDPGHACAKGDYAACPSHEEEQSSDILHQIMLLTASQHPDDPAEEDDGYGHAYEADRHPLEVERVPLVLPYCLRQIDWQISWEHR